MDNEFKVPTFEPKFKTIPEKSEQTEEDVESNTEPLPSVPTKAEKESTGAKVESSSADKIKCPYVEPKWSRLPDPDTEYKFEVLKGGQIVENFKNLERKAFWAIGKLPGNDIVMAHPTISRYHAVLQYRPDIPSTDDDSDSDSDGEEEDDIQPNAEPQKPKVESGWYLYDLNSTHGSFVNKMRVPPKTYIRVRVGYMLKFGASTRNYILQGPDFDQEAESELTLTEMKELRNQKVKELTERMAETMKRQAEEEKQKEEEGINWGMADDADEETDLTHNPFAATNNEELFLQDPKKTLRGFFEREGLDLDYKVDEVSNGTYVCKIELPITDSMGRPLMAEFTHKGKKKECVVQCALEACRILDRNGVLRQANHEPRKRRLEASDDDDDDEFYDRTAEAEEKRKRKSGNEKTTTLSYDQLLEEEKSLQTQLAETEKRIEHYQQMEKQARARDAMDVDDLDDFVKGLSSEKLMDKSEIRKSRFEIQRIKADLVKVEKLINLTRPVNLPALKLKDHSEPSQQHKKQLPLFGKKRTFGLAKTKIHPSHTKPTSTISKKEEPIEEFDDDDAEAENVKTNQKASDTLDDTEKMEHKQEETRLENDEKLLEGTSDCMNTLHASRKSKPKPQLITKCDIPNRLNSTSNETPAEKTVTSDSVGSNPKRKSKNKNRSCNRDRSHVDIDDTEEDASPQKYSSWVPPENQRGDGITDLNSKYGY